ncbi:hypothetical protein EDB84DRAFT_1678160 [Lactarius hengduanensis]|nr:hypothetical protein EDB84DRAFT_1678160 [Lactarius hengduanensis]
MSPQDDEDWASAKHVNCVGVVRNKCTRLLATKSSLHTGQTVTDTDTGGRNEFMCRASYQYCSAGRQRILGVWDQAELDLGQRSWSGRAVFAVLGMYCMRVGIILLDHACSLHCHMNGGDICHLDKRGMASVKPRSLAPVDVGFDLFCPPNLTRPGGFLYEPHFWHLGETDFGSLRKVSGYLCRYRDNLGAACQELNHPDLADPIQRNFKVETHDGRNIFQPHEEGERRDDPLKLFFAHHPPLYWLALTEVLNFQYALHGEKASGPCWTGKILSEPNTSTWGSHAIMEQGTSEVQMVPQSSALPEFCIGATGTVTIAIQYGNPLQFAAQHRPQPLRPIILGGLVICVASVLM